MLTSILQGMIPLLSFKMMSILFLGSLVGMLFGFIPGLDGMIGLSILIPLVYGMPLNISLALLLSMHASIAFGGSISAILFNIPGSGLNIATCFDGYAMSQKGEAAKAIGIAGTSSFIGGFFGALVLAIFLPVIRPLILLFGPAEFLMVTIFGNLVCFLESKK
ncbi:MAG TPA: tripartite tricarboxylate transporter permease, partial [Atribacterota bacterium]|nr:tripartite tricarboxylate transporter permease [Atribacterota bacterium]